jgi:NADPH:quinone reductase-like Zn-dependent oxidoreductase
MSISKIREDTKMKAIIYEKYGAPEVHQLKEIEKPVPKNNEILVKIHASAINSSDATLTRGKPFLGRLWQGFLKPKNKTLGSDIAGKVEAVGNSVKEFKAGDEVFGDISDIGFGGFAQYVAVPEKAIILKPSNLTFEEAAAIPQASVVALQGLRNHGQIQQGQKVLINGASAGIGTFAVQIAKSFGAEVTGVCSTKKMDLIRSIGADYVIDYTKEDFTISGKLYDLIFDVHVSHSISEYKKALATNGVYIACDFNPTSVFLGPLISLSGSKKVKSYIAKLNTKDLTFIKELIETGKIKPVIDKRYPLSKVSEAIQYYEKKHTQGKIVITVEHNNKK